MIDVAKTGTPASSSSTVTFFRLRDFTAALVRVRTTACGIGRRAMRA